MTYVQFVMGSALYRVCLYAFGVDFRQKLSKRLLPTLVLNEGPFAYPQVVSYLIFVMPYVQFVIESAL